MNLSSGNTYQECLTFFLTLTQRRKELEMPIGQDAFPNIVDEDLDGRDILENTQSWYWQTSCWRRAEGKGIENSDNSCARLHCTSESYNVCHQATQFKNCKTKTLRTMCKWLLAYRWWSQSNWAIRIVIHGAWDRWLFAAYSLPLSIYKHD